ncbi:hypothetical protein F5882DRAFT_489680, partial [Hyaloscypha sp. PMI_1271]
MKAPRGSDAGSAAGSGSRVTCYSSRLWPCFNVQPVAVDPKHGFPMTTPWGFAAGPGSRATSSASGSATGSGSRVTMSSSRLRPCFSVHPVAADPKHGFPLMPVWGSATGSGSRVTMSSSRLRPCFSVHPVAADPKHGFPLMPVWGSATGSGSRARSSSVSLFCPCTRVQPGAEDPKHGVRLVMLSGAESGAPRMEGRMERMIAVMVSPDENC